MIDAGLSQREARTRFYAIDRDGLLVEGMKGILDFQEPFVQKAGAVAGWSREHPDKISLLDVVHNAKPTVLIGVSAQGGMFSETVIRAMAAGVERPIVFPLSNPTSCAEAAPQDVMNWTEGRAEIGTGSPFPPVIFAGRTCAIAQTNNAYVFPGMGLGVLAAKARRVSDGMFAAAAKALAEVSPALKDPAASLLPPVSELRSVAVTIAAAVAKQARADGLCAPFDDAALPAMISAKMWEPVYRPYRRKQ
jgi:malate dehydrogenase (oxaloacetate-decarboxylating)